VVRLHVFDWRFLVVDLTVLDLMYLFCFLISRTLAFDCICSVIAIVVIVVIVVIVISVSIE